jgi:hypothetical protein
MEPVIEAWGRKNYPRLMGNPRAIEQLYKRQVLGQPTMTNQITAYPLSKIVDFKQGKVVTALVTKVEAHTRTLDVCKQCFKRTCEHAGGERIPFYVCRMIGVDETSTESFERLGTDKSLVDVIEENTEFIVSGALKVDEKWGREFQVKNIAPLTKEQLEAWDKLDDYAEVHGGEGGLSEEEFELATKLNRELLSPFFERVYISHVGGRVRW